MQEVRIGDHNGLLWPYFLNTVKRLNFGSASRLQAPFPRHDLCGETGLVATDLGVFLPASLLLQLFCSMAATFTLNFFRSGIQFGSWGSFQLPGLLNFGEFKVRYACFTASPVAPGCSSWLAV